MTMQETETVIRQFSNESEERIRVKRDIPDNVKMIYAVVFIAFIASTFLWMF